jgi:hypothetical protein
LQRREVLSDQLPGLGRVTVEVLRFKFAWKHEN